MCLQGEREELHIMVRTELFLSGSSSPVVHPVAPGFETEAYPLKGGEGSGEVECHNHCLQTLDGEGLVKDVLCSLHQT